ncbi:UNVERIFIED_CONTAM: hypothetical protein K2H54_020798 [Gekko kuhli]
MKQHAAKMDDDGLGGECKPKSRTPKVKGERKKKPQHSLSRPPQLPLQQLLPPLLLPQPPLSRQEEERQLQAPLEEDRLQAKPRKSASAEESTPPMPALASETPGKEKESKAHPSIQKLYSVQRPRKSSSQKKRMSCQQMLEKFLTQEQAVDLRIKDEESGEGDNTEGPTEPSKLQAALRSDDITLWRIPKRERRELFKRVSGKPARYAAAVFSRMVPPDELRRWRGAVSYRGGGGKRALPRNVVARLRRLLHQQFWDIVAADWRRIRSEINKILGT